MKTEISKIFIGVACLGLLVINGCAKEETACALNRKDASSLITITEEGYGITDDGYYVIYDNDDCWLYIKNPEDSDTPTNRTRRGRMGFCFVTGEDREYFYDYEYTILDSFDECLENAQEEYEEALTFKSGNDQIKQGELTEIVVNDIAYDCMVRTSSSSNSNSTTMYIWKQIGTKYVECNIWFYTTRDTFDIDPNRIQQALDAIEE